MFGLGDEFEIDESFLDDVFEIEKTVSNTGPKRKNDGHSSLEDTHLNILKESAANSSFLSSSDNDSTAVLTSTQGRNRPAGVGTPCTLDTRNTCRENYVSKESSSRKVRPRKFPGPAGLLPERHGNSSLIATEDFLNELEQELKEETTFKEDDVLSQDSARNLESPAWAELIHDLGSDGQALLKRLNVASVCARAKQTRALKVPFLALLIQNVDASTADPCLYLSDTTGEIVGAVHREVWEQLGQDLVPGTVIVLINVGVLCAGHTTARHYLNITTNNIAALYSPTNGSDIRVMNMKPLSQPDCSTFLQVWQDLVSSPVPQPSQSTVDASRQLFSTASLTPTSTAVTPRRLNLNSPAFNKYKGNSLNKSFDASFSCQSPSLNPPSRFPNGSTNRYLSSSPLNNSFRPNFSVKPFHRPNSQRLQNPVHSHLKPPIPSSMPKRPRFETSANLPTINDSLSPNVLRESPASQSIVESLLDGIDTDSLFGDF